MSELESFENCNIILDAVPEAGFTKLDDGQTHPRLRLARSPGKRFVAGHNSNEYSAPGQFCNERK